MNRRQLKLATGVVLFSVHFLTGCAPSRSMTSEGRRPCAWQRGQSGVLSARTNALNAANLGERFRCDGDRESLRQLIGLAESLPESPYAIEELFRLGKKIKEQGLCDLLGPVVLRGLQSQKDRVFTTACLMVEWLGKSAEPAVDLLVDSIQAEEGHRTFMALWALRRMGPLARHAASGLLAKLACTSPPARSTERMSTRFEEMILATVRSVGVPDSHAADKVRQFLYVRDDGSRRVAAMCLLEYDVSDVQAAEEIVRQLRARDKGTVSDTLWSIKGMRQVPDNVVSAVAKVAEEECRSNRGRVAIGILSDMARQRPKK